MAVNLETLANVPRGRVFPGGELDANAIIIQQLVYYPDLHDLPPRLKEVPPPTTTPTVKNNDIYPIHLDQSQNKDGGDEFDIQEPHANWVPDTDEDNDEPAPINPYL